MWQALRALDGSVWCLDGFALFYIVVVDFGLTCGLIFGDLP